MTIAESFNLKETLMPNPDRPLPCQVGADAQPKYLSSVQASSQSAELCPGK